MACTWMDQEENCRFPLLAVRQIGECMSKLLVFADFTVWYTPIIFLSSFIKIIKLILQDKEYKWYLPLRSTNFWLIVVPAFVAVFNYGWH